DHRKDARALLWNDSAWTALNIQFKSKARSESTQTALLGILSTKIASETARLQLFFPLGKHKVGRTPNLPGVIPGIDSPLRSAATLDSPLRSAATLIRNSSTTMDQISNSPASPASDDLMVEVSSEPQSRPSVDEQSSMDWEAEYPRRIDDHIARQGGITLPGVPRSRSEEVAAQWRAAFDETMSAFGQILRRSPPVMSGLDQAAIESNVIGW